MPPIELSSKKYTASSAMNIVDKTVESHKSICTSIGLFSKYEESTKSEKNIGGVESEKCQAHLVGRFLNSAVRTQLATLDPDDELLPINTELLAQLHAGTLHIIDIAAGSGAGVISMINCIWYLRAISRILPTEKTDIYIHALDHSKESLDYYSQQLASLAIDYASVGIKIYFHSHEIDITSSSEIQSKVLEIKGLIGQDPRFLLVCSAISGVKRSFFEQKFENSYKLILQEFKQCNSIFFWVEPFTPKHWIYDTVRKILRFISPENPLLLHDIIIRFYWKDPHLSNTLAAGAELYLIKLAS